MDNSIYVKFEYNTLLDGKKQILSSQINCLNILKKMESYGLLRKKEYIYKLKIKNNIKEIKEKLSMIDKQEIPKKAHEILNQKIKDEKIIQISNKEEINDQVKSYHHELSFNNQIQEDLLDIQKRLAKLA